MSNTVTNYLSRINRNFPVRGQDNDSQGFRDNWKNIYEAVNILNDRLDLVSYFSVKTNDLSSFYGNTFEDVTVKNGSTQVYDIGPVPTLIKINYQNGSYQKFQVTSGIYQLSVVNWPSSGKSGRIRLAVTAPKNSYSAINFDSNYIPINSPSNLFGLDGNKPNIFEVWNEDGSDIVYVININSITTDNNEFTSTSWTNKLKLGNLNDNNQINVYYTGTNKSTIVRRGNQIAEIGLVPNRVTKNLIDGIDKSTTEPIELLFKNVADVVPNAFLYVSITNTIFTVTSITTNSIFISPGNFNVSKLTLEEPITLTNPGFIEQPKLLTLSSISANTLTGIVSNFQGSVYADEHQLEVTYKQFGNNFTNTFVIKTLQTSTETSVVSTEIANTQFVHSLIPMGTIIMWYGKKSDIPYGWTLCDNKGSITSIVNGKPGPIIKVPNLSNRFIAGGEEDVYDKDTGVYRGPGTTVASTVTSTRGGLANAVVVNHSHDAEFTGREMPLHYHKITDPEHIHTNGKFTYLLPNYETRHFGNDGNDNNEDLRGNTPALDYSFPMISRPTGITINPSSGGTATGIAYVYQEGVEGRYKNIPPFYALYYIMKISGASNSNLPVPSGDSVLPTEPSPWPAMPERPTGPFPPPDPEQLPPYTPVTRILTVTPSTPNTFQFTLGSTSPTQTITCTNTGNTPMKIYAVQSNSTEGIYGIITNAGTFVKTLAPNASFSFDIAYTSSTSSPGTYNAFVVVVYQNSIGNMDNKYIRTTQIVS